VTLPDDCLPLRDLARIGPVLEVILRPQDAEDPDQYKRAVLETVKPLLGADVGAYLVHTGRRLSWVSDFPAVSFEDYGVNLESTAHGVDIWARHLELKVHRRDEVWLPIRRDFYETAYYQDVLSQLRAFDSMGATWRTGPGQGKENLTQFLVHHSSPHGPTFGARQKAILTALRPALKAGLAHSAAAGGRLGEFLKSTDMSGTVSLVVDSQGRILHANEAARRLFALDVESERVIREALLLQGVPQRRSSAGGSPQTWPAMIKVTLGGFEALLSITRTSREGHRGIGYLITLTGAAPQDAMLDLELLGRAKGLTPRQAEVAALLCKRLRSREISELLGLKMSTVRRYEERVFQRLGIHSRIDVKNALLAVD